MNWWDRDTPEDEALLRVIGEAKRLVRLPRPEDIPERQRKITVGSCLTYFGSFENALRRVAKLLYGHPDLTAPNDLLPHEKELSEAEREEVLERRRSYYREMLEKLKGQGALQRMRREEQAELERQRRLKDTEGYTVRQIPIRTRQQMREVIGEEQLRREARSTSGLIRRKSEVGDQRKRPPTFREQWEKSSMNPANQPKSVRVNKPKTLPVVPSRTEALVAKPELPIRKGDDNMGRPRVTKEEILEMLSRIYEHYGHTPSKAEIMSYVEEHPEERIVYWSTFWSKLGPKETWEAQLEDYKRGQKVEADVGDDGRESVASVSSSAKNSLAGNPDPEEAEEPQASDVSDAEEVEVPQVPEALGAEEVEASQTPEILSTEETKESQMSVPIETPSTGESDGQQSLASGGTSDAGRPEVTSSEVFDAGEPEMVAPADEPSLHEEVKEEKKPKKMKINLLGASFRLLLDGQEYEIELEFGRD